MGEERSSCWRLRYPADAPAYSAGRTGAHCRSFTEAHPHPGALVLEVVCTGHGTRDDASGLSLVIASGDENIAAADVGELLNSRWRVEGYRASRVAEPHPV